MRSHFNFYYENISIKLKRGLILSINKYNYVNIVGVGNILQNTLFLFFSFLNQTLNEDKFEENQLRCESKFEEKKEIR